MTRRTMAERKRRGADRTARRESLLVLLSRTRRGVALTDAEGALLFAHVEVELAEADELRRTVAGQQTAIQAANNRAEAADAVIREVEQDRDQARAELAELQAAAKQAQQRARAERPTPDAEHATMNRHLDSMRTRAEKAEERLTAYVAVFGPDAPEDFHTMQHRAERRLDAWRRAEEDVDRWRSRAETAEQALQRVREADSLAAALAAVAEHDGLTPQAAAAHAAFALAADTAEARLAEQQRAHEIALARVERRTRTAERNADISEQQAETLRREVHRAEEDARRERRRGDGWKRHALDTDHKADRYRTAWMAARRDRKADRAAMADELHLVRAGRNVLAIADDLFIAGRTEVERELGRRLLAACAPDHPRAQQPEHSNQ
ncbi:hypothetical protein AB0D33_38135 [Streptomyces sp. NPDC048404]|uniref:hypothetical protein n=1 Tax=unclassified Streptomyces TaxID=2593676 RepID=UPI003442B03A